MVTFYGKLHQNPTKGGVGLSDFPRFSAKVLPPPNYKMALKGSINLG